MLPIGILLFSVLYFPAVLFLKRKTKFTQRFKWPPFYFVAALGLSLIPRPGVYATIDWYAHFHRLCFCGYLVFAALYATGWWKSGRKMAVPLASFWLTDVI
jgi:hypothetical protein